MATPSEKLASSLEVLKLLQSKGVIAIQSSDLSRLHRERLVKNGFLQEVIKGWYIPSRQDETVGESTAWYASFWDFCVAYLDKRFNNQWCLSPEQSLALHAGNWTIPNQLLVYTPKGQNNITKLPYQTSILDVKHDIPLQKYIINLNGLRVIGINHALVYSTPRFYVNNVTDVKTVLSLVRDASDILNVTLDGGHSTIAARIAGALRHIGRNTIANEITKTMNSAGYKINEVNPFESLVKIGFSHHERSPYVNRLKILWQEMRDVVIKHFPSAIKKKVNTEVYLKHVNKIYITDAYHSLSIEGYRVSEALIDRVRSGSWSPENNQEDKDHVAALAARGYWQAFNAVEKSLRHVLDGQNAGRQFEKDHRDWYREMFTPYIVAGVLKPSDLAGYRNSPVYIRRSKHVPPNIDAVRDLMPVLSDLLMNETEASVRIVLGHFFFVYIHPYMDGNGRMGRFLMNLMCASGGYPWVIVPVEKRKIYMAALEEASVEQNIKPFTEFIAGLIGE
ncbi:MAG TPA: Fic family protein [Gammaproteobacteria bacterium]|nr:Fic family protein [Gammaproteobacteria bacterium]